MKLKEYLNKYDNILSEKAKDGEYYIISMPQKNKIKLLGGPFKSYNEAVKKYGNDKSYGINQDQVIAVFKNGELFMPHHRTREATKNRLSVILGSRYKNLEKILGLK